MFDKICVNYENYFLRETNRPNNLELMLLEFLLFAWELLNDKNSWFGITFKESIKIFLELWNRDLTLNIQVFLIWISTQKLWKKNNVCTQKHNSIWNQKLQNHNFPPTLKLNSIIINWIIIKIELHNLLLFPSISQNWCS